MSSPESPLVIVSKSALSSDSRNPALSLLQSAGFGDVVDLDRCDEARVQGVRFRAMKGPGAVAANMPFEQAQATAFLLGSDVLAEAALIARSYGVRTDIQRLLSLGIGPCRLRFLAPNEQQIIAPSDLKRQIFSKYPMLTRSALRALLGSGGSVMALEGADTRTCEWRGSGRAVAAYEIVESGRTARENNLQIVEGDFPYPTGSQLKVPFFDPNNITTDLYTNNLTVLQGEARDRLQEFALALEAARQRNSYAMFQCHVPVDKIDAFVQMGMQSPSVQPLVGRPDWKALTIAVPIVEQQKYRRILMDLGAEGIVQFPATGELSRAESEVYRAFDSAAQKTETVPELPDAQKMAQRIVARLKQIQNCIVDRPTGDTAKALSLEPKMAQRYCADSVVAECVELLEAVSREAEEEAIIEASHCLNWYLCTLYITQIELQPVLSELAQLLKVSLPAVDTEEQLAVILGAVTEPGRRLNYDNVYDMSRHLSFEATRFSTTARKSEDSQEKVRAAAAMLLEWLKMLEVALLRLDDVIAKL